MRIEIDPVPDECLRGCLATAQSVLPPSRGTLLILALYGAVILCAFYFTPTTRAGTTLIGIGAVAVTYFALRFDGQRRLRRAWRSDPHANEATFVELSPEGLRTGCAHIDARYPWSDFAKVSESADFFLFARPSGAGAAIPKRVIAGPSEAELRRCIADWWGDLQSPSL